jgi:hypothetical protein
LLLRSQTITALLAQPCAVLSAPPLVLLSSSLTSAEGSPLRLEDPTSDKSIIASTAGIQYFRRGEQQVHSMSGQADYEQHQQFVAYCNSSCSPTPLTTVYTPLASCTDNWTPVNSWSFTSGYTVSLTRNVTAADCAPTQWIQGCQSCPDVDDTSNISPGVCPEDAPAASTGIEGGVTAHYCCPL